MFCPNCGTQNDSAATPCKKCGFKLSGISIPKFKGTMMLNSDQTVQELIDEHRRKQAEGGVPDKNRGRASEPPPGRAPSVPPPSRAPSTPPPAASAGQRGAVLQPPRAAGGASKRRMGGTMLGVAPQAGGLLPPQVPATVPVPQVPSVEPSRSDTAAAPDAPFEAAATPAEAPGEGPADPFAGTYELPTSEPPAVGAALGEPAPAPAVNATRPLEAAPSNGSADAEPPQAAPEPARRRPLAATTALPAQPESAPRADTEPVAESLVPPKLRALDVVLLVCTLGLYGIVLWARRRKHQTPNA